MNKIFRITLFVALAFSAKANAQKAYFQQEVNYKINVSLDDVKHELTADERIEYINNSPDALPVIYMHLWPNAYKNNNTALVKQLVENGDTKLYYAKPEDRGYIDQLDFKVDGAPVKMEYMGDSIDICKLILNKPLAAGAKIVITTPFHVKIPLGIYSRMGHLDQAYQITQWYPKPAVYDVNGWNPIPYLNQGEFYSEFGSFDVSITLPKNYVVGATGDLVDGEKETAWLNEKVKETEAIKEYSKDLSYPASDKETKTLRYKQSKVHDFAWFADKRFHVLKGEAEMPHTKHKVTTWVMFTNSEPKLWKNAIEYMNDALHYYSLWNGDYPYNHCTAIDGALTAGAGMEYPNITVIGPSSNAFIHEITIMHEVGHNWFYGMLGSNERIHPWMDEGLNSFNEQRYIYTKYPSDKFKGRSEVGDLSFLGTSFGIDRLNHLKEGELSYTINAAVNADQPIEEKAYNYTSLNYAGVVYSKTALVYDYLKDYLGEELFDKCMQQYFNTWQYKHPQPQDVRAVFEKTTGKDLSWFFDDMIKTKKKIDYKIASVHKNDLVIKNVGQVNGPVSISALKNGKVIESKWEPGFTGKKNITFPAGDYDKFKIDAQEKMPEVNRDNNTIRTSGVFKKIEPIKFQFLASIPNPNKTEIYYTPVIGWNSSNKTLVGIAFYNSLIPMRRFDYAIMPMYGTGSNTFAGGADLGYSFYPNKIFRKIRLGVKAEQYAYDVIPVSREAVNYNKIAPELTFDFKKTTPRSPVQSTLKYRYISIGEEQIDYADNKRAGTESRYNISEFSYLLMDKSTINPYSVKLLTEFGDNFNRQFAELKYRISYRKNKKGIDFRLFGSYSDKFGYQLSNYSGSADYKYDEVFLGRNQTKGLLSYQMSEAEGGFKSANFYGAGYQWLTTLNVKAPMPGKLPLGIFGGVGTFKDAKTINISGNSFVYEGGLYFSVGDGIFEIYWPLLISKDIKAYQDQSRSQIRFVINFNRLNPINFIRNAAF